jgi:D-alanine-D-alanine ligase
MRVLVLHSDVAPDAPPDEQDTLATADAVAVALRARNHCVSLSSFVPDPLALERALAESQAEIVFNLVESVLGQGDLAGVAPAMLERRGVPFTGATAAALACAADKPFAKRILVDAGLPTPRWAAPPSWDGLADDEPYVVKSTTEDASLGLDDGAIATGRKAIFDRAALCATRFGGAWFAEAYCPGREFNLSVLQESHAPRVLPIAETRFDDWDADRPRLVGYAAKWNAHSQECLKTPRRFGIERELPDLAASLRNLALRSWQVLGMRGYARVDFRLDAEGRPMILEINPNPCLEPQAGFAAAAQEAGIAYTELVERILGAGKGGSQFPQNELGAA